MTPGPAEGLHAGVFMPHLFIAAVNRNPDKPAVILTGALRARYWADVNRQVN